MFISGGNPCEKSPCSDGFVCLLSASDASGRVCKCPDGVEQVTVGNRLICQDVPAHARPCQLRCNQGACEIENGRPRCVCPVDFDGEFCEHYRCSGYCKNHGTCYVNASDYKVGSRAKPPLKCDCPRNWEGDRCDISASSCRLLCHNGAKCASNGTETCICPRGFSGKSCQNCDDLSCENDGVCQRDASGRPMCQCKRGYTGRRCEKDVCEGYCGGHGQCKMLQVGSLQCICDKGYWGKQCQSDSCAGYCENGGTCTINNANEKSCQCLPTFFGMRCEDSNACQGDQCNADINQCDRVQCENGGTCHVSDGSAICSCPPQWSGQLCEVSVRATRVSAAVDAISSPPRRMPPRRAAAATTTASTTECARSTGPGVRRADAPASGSAGAAEIRPSASASAAAASREAPSTSACKRYH